MEPYTKEFEEKFAKRVGAKYAYAVSNGTAALHCVRAVDIYYTFGISNSARSDSSGG
jgi:dTDP-4-amino-4,6-dideoxygalactose transaminase